MNTVKTTEHPSHYVDIPEDGHWQCRLAAAFGNAPRTDEEEAKGRKYLQHFTELAGEPVYDESQRLQTQHLYVPSGHIVVFKFHMLNESISMYEIVDDGDSVSFVPVPSKDIEAAFAKEDTCGAF